MMSDEPTPKDTGGEWVMPEPVFRTSEGRKPKSLIKTNDADEIDTQSPDPDEIDQIDPDLVDTAIPNLDNSAEEQSDAPETPDALPANTVRAAPVKTPKPKRGCAKSFLFIIGAMGLAAAAIIIGLIYFLYYYRTPDNSPF